MRPTPEVQHAGARLHRARATWIQADRDLSAMGEAGPEKTAGAVALVQRMYVAYTAAQQAFREAEAAAFNVPEEINTADEDCTLTLCPSVPEQRIAEMASLASHWRTYAADHIAHDRATAASIAISKAEGLEAQIADLRADQGKE